ncbi:MAG: HAD family hydrolase [Clostridiales bacterium]|nr:HAD family hydrolase [Clostridiales bacterium]
MLRRLIICDIDNTLLPAGGVISDVTRKALAELDPDTGFSIATGRSFHVVRKFVEDLDLKLPVITSNGAQVYDFAAGKPVYESCFTEASATFVISTLLSEGFDFVAYGKDGIFHRRDSSHMAFFLNYNSSVREEIRAPLIPLSEDDPVFVPDGLTKILVYFPTENLRRRLLEHPDLEVTASMHGVADIMAKGSTKGNAVVALSDYLKVPLSDTYCFGDNDNDISMFTCGAVGVAMGNATEEAKRHASIITRTCKDDGVAYAIRHLL